VQDSANADADQMASDFTRLVDDLAYAKTFYPGSKVTRHINTLASRIYLGIYQNQKAEANRIVRFWKYDVPLVLRKHQLLLLICFILFVVFFAVGFFSASVEPQFIHDALGDTYVRMTEENIRNGNPFGVYQSGNAFFAWVGIMFNNIGVALTYYAKGFLFGVFPVIAMLKEAIRIGAFEQFFFKQGLGMQSVLTVFIHGTLELTSIIVATAAGVVFGKSFLFPGTMKRLESFKEGAREGVIIVAGLIPVFMIAAFFEGFVPRHYTMHWSLSSSILLVSVIFIVWYFVIYPMRVEKEARQHLNENE